MDIKDMCHGVQLILARIDTNPEEFTKGGKWDWVTDRIRKVYDEKYESLWSQGGAFAYLRQEEVNVIYDKLSPIYRDEFSAAVLRTLADDDDVESRQRKLFQTAQQPAVAVHNALHLKCIQELAHQPPQIAWKTLNKLLGSRK